jgi:glycosyltransferase involved in cell wall biosynthesis
MKILHVVHGFADEATGGTELHVRDLARRQASAAGGGHDVAIFAPTRRDGVSDFAFLDLGAEGGVRRFAFNHRGERGISFLERDDLPAAVVAFGKACDAHRPDVVHVHHLAGLSAGVLAEAKRRGARLVLTVHDHALACPRGRRIRLDLEACPVLDRSRCVRCVRPQLIEAARSPRRFRAWLGLFRPGEGARLFSRRDRAVRAALDHVDVFFAPSDSAAALFREFYDAGRRLRTLPHGSPGVGAVAPPTFPEGNGLRVAFFGAAHPTKGAHVAAEAVARLGAGSTLAIHGAVGDEERARLRRAGGGAVLFRGPYAPEDVGARMAAAQVVVVPSLWPETFSLVLREAWAYRRPAVVSRIGALEGAAGESESRALLAAPGDVADWASVLGRAATVRALFERLTGPFSDGPRELSFDAATSHYL